MSNTAWLNQTPACAEGWVLSVPCGTLHGEPQLPLRVRGDELDPPALYSCFLRAGDRVAVKPLAVPLIRREYDEDQFQAVRCAV